MTQKNYDWVDNPTESGVAIYDPDILNECLMHLKYDNANTTAFCINRGSVDENNIPNLLSYNGNQLKFNCGISIIPTLSSNTQNNWTLTASHTAENGFDIYKSFDEEISSYCRLIATPSVESPAYIQISYSSEFQCDYIYLKFNDLYNADSMKNFFIINSEEDILFSSNDNITFLEKDEFLIPIFGYSATSLKILTTESVNSTSYVNFPNIKLLKKEQVLAYSDIKGKTSFTINIAPITISTQTNGIKNIALKNNEAEIIGNIYKNYLAPETPTTGDIWLNKSEEPLMAYQWNGAHWLPYSGIPIGSVVIASNQISSVKTFSYNVNDYFDPQNWKLFFPDYSKKISLAVGSAEKTYTIPCDGIISVELFGYNNAWAHLYINNIEIIRGTSGEMALMTSLNGIYPVKKGDVIRYKNYADGGVHYARRVDFYPAKGEC